MRDAGTEYVIKVLEMHRAWIIADIQTNPETAALRAIRDIDKHIYFLNPELKPQSHDNAAAATTSASGAGLDDVIGAPGFDQEADVRGGKCDPDEMEVWALAHGYKIECQTEDACDGIVLVSDRWIIEMDEDGAYTACVNTPNMLSQICDSYRVECELRRTPEVD